jgi:hypothetical protein
MTGSLAVAVAALTACATASPPAPKAHAAAAVSKPKAAPAGCALALVTLPDPGLATERQAGYQAAALEAASRKATGQVAVLAGMAAVDAGFVRMDLLTGRSANADVATWDHDTGKLRSYCRS